MTMRVKPFFDAAREAVPVMPAQGPEITNDGPAMIVEIRDIPATDLPHSAWHGGWPSRLAGALRRALSALLRPRPDLRALTPHMQRDIGLIDTAPDMKLP